MAGYEDINKRLERIEALLQKLPEIQAAVFLRMYDEYRTAQMRGKKAADIWEIAPPNQR